MARDGRGLASATAGPPAPEADRLWTQPEAAQYLAVSVAYLRASTCPKVLLPAARGQKPLVRYCPADVLAWVRRWRTA